MKAKQIKKKKYYLSITNELHQVTYLFDKPEKSPINDEYIIGRSMNIKRGFSTRFSADFFVKEVNPEEFPEYFI